MKAIEYMPDSPMRFKLSGSVGLRGRNLPNDIRTVQKALNNHLLYLSPLPRLAEDGSFGSNIQRSKTLAAIKLYQKEVVGLKHPDGLISVNGPTHRELNGLVGLAKKVKVFTFHDSNCELSRPVTTLAACLATIPHHVRTELHVHLMNVITYMHEQGIAMGVLPGIGAGYRSFQQQFREVSTNGPGESVHNYGLAADLVVLEWGDRHGKAYFSDYRLEQMGKMPEYAGLPAKIWHLRNRVEPIFLYPHPPGKKDPAHLQLVSTKYSGKQLLLRTLEEVVKGSDVQYRVGSHGYYECYFPDAGKWVMIGTARMMWAGTIPNANAAQTAMVQDHMKKCEHVARWIKLYHRLA